MPKILCLTGWGQKFDSLENIFNEPFFAPFSVVSCDYLKLSNFAEVIAADEIVKNDADIVVGWSLGGQLAVRLIEKKILTPKLLVLIAPPFQMLKDANIQAGMSIEVYNQFYQNFVQAPDATLKQFVILTAMNDKNAKEIAKTIDINKENFAQLKFWLEELKRFSCFNVDFSNMPKTLYFHGAGDMIVHVSQAEYFKKNIKNFDIEILKNCGHAPHLSDIELVRKKIRDAVNANSG